jgi:hypothetical protein
MSVNRCVYAFFEPVPTEADRLAGAGGCDARRPDPALIVIAIVAGFGWIATATMVEQVLRDVIRSCC